MGILEAALQSAVVTEPKQLRGGGFHIGKEPVRVRSIVRICNPTNSMTAGQPKAPSVGTKQAMNSIESPDPKRAVAADGHRCLGVCTIFRPVDCVNILACTCLVSACCRRRYRLVRAASQQDQP